MSPQVDGEPALVRVPRDDGAVVYLELYRGPASVPTILILDGIGCSGWAFKRVIPPLRVQGSVALLHYSGHGHSPLPPRPWRLSIPDLADDAAAAIEAAELGPVVAVGFSMGFQVALELYRRHRPLVAGMVSVAGPSGRALAQFQGTEMFGHAMPLVRAAVHFARDATKDLWRKIVPSRFSKLVGLYTQVNTQRIEEADFEYYMQQMAKVNPELFVDLLEEAHRHCADDLLPELEIPVLVVAGAGDRFVPLGTMRSMAFTIPGAEWVVFPDATHALPAEYPEELADRIARFRADLASPSR